MKTLLTTSLIAAALIASSAPADACSIRGRYCDYPLWAANAFEGPLGTVNPNSGPVLESRFRPGAFAYAPESRRAWDRRARHRR